MGEEATLVFLADPGEGVVDETAQRDGHLERLRFDPAERAEQRQHAGGDALAVHPGEVEFHVIERLRQRLLAVPGRLQHLDAVRVAFDARIPGPRAQRLGQLGGPPVGMHVDHGGLLLLAV
ncbi:hypothetical protein D3C83_12760 [compost metagenome]